MLMKVSIRPLQLSDAAVLSQQLNNKKIWNNISNSIPYPYTLDDTEFFIKMSHEDRNLYNFAITYNENFCGVIGLKRQKDIHRKSEELGYWIAEPFWNKGIATQAIGMVTEWAFQHLKTNRIFAGVFQHNIASMKALEKNGFKKEGILKKAIYKNSKFLDEHLYAKLKDE